MPFLSTDILNYLHTSKRLVFNDLKAENILVFQSGRFSQTIKIADLEHAAVIGAKRDHVCSPYICPPELARAICHDEQVEVNAKEDVWAVGVMVLRLMGLKNPFELGEGEGGDETEGREAPGAA